MQPRSLGRTPLYWAARNGHTETAARLVDLRADPNAKDIVCAASPPASSTPRPSVLLVDRERGLTSDRLVTTLIQSDFGEYLGSLGHTPLDFANWRGDR